LSLRRNGVARGKLLAVILSHWRHQPFRQSIEFAVAEAREKISQHRQGHRQRAAIRAVR
jgi:hypothetical protein